MGDIKGSDDRLSGETCSGGEEPTGGASSETDKAVTAGAGGGGLGSSEEAMPDLWWSGENMEERSETTCFAVERSGKGRGDGPSGLPTPDKVRKLQITLYRKAKAEKLPKAILGANG